MSQLIKKIEISFDSFNSSLESIYENTKNLPLSIDNDGKPHFLSLNFRVTKDPKLEASLPNLADRLKKAMEHSCDINKREKAHEIFNKIIKFNYLDKGVSLTSDLFILRGIQAFKNTLDVTRFKEIPDELHALYVVKQFFYCLSVALNLDHVATEHAQLKIKDGPFSTIINFNRKTQKYELNPLGISVAIRSTLGMAWLSLNKADCMPNSDLKFLASFESVSSDPLEKLVENYIKGEANITLLLGYLKCAKSQADFCKGLSPRIRYFISNIIRSSEYLERLPTSSTEFYKMAEGIMTDRARMDTAYKTLYGEYRHLFPKVNLDPEKNPDFIYYDPLLNQESFSSNSVLLFLPEGFVDEIGYSLTETPYSPQIYTYAVHLGFKDISQEGKAEKVPSKKTKPSKQKRISSSPKDLPSISTPKAAQKPHHVADLLSTESPTSSSSSLSSSSSPSLASTPTPKRPAAATLKPPSSENLLPSSSSNSLSSTSSPSLSSTPTPKRPAAATLKPPSSENLLPSSSSNSLSSTSSPSLSSTPTPKRPAAATLKPPSSENLLPSSSSSSLSSTSSPSLSSTPTPKRPVAAIPKPTSSEGSASSSLSSSSSLLPAAAAVAGPAHTPPTYTFAQRVRVWRENPGAALRQASFAHLPPDLKKAMLWRHDFPRVIDYFVGTAYSFDATWKNPRTKKEDPICHILAEIEWEDRKGKKQRTLGRFEYSIDENNICYHRYFQYLNDLELADFFHMRHETDFPTLETSQQLLQENPCKRAVVVPTAAGSYTQGPLGTVVIHDSENNFTITLFKLNGSA